MIANHERMICMHGDGSERQKPAPVPAQAASPAPAPQAPAPTPAPAKGDEITETQKFAIRKRARILNIDAEKIIADLKTKTAASATITQLDQRIEQMKK